MTRSSCVLLAFLYVVASPPGRVSAQTAEHKVQSSSEATYVDGDHLVHARRLGGGRVRLGWPDGRSVEAGIDLHAIVRAADRRALTGRDLREVRELSRGAGLYLVRSTRTGEDGLALAARLRDDPELEVVPDLALARRRAAIAIPPNDPRYAGQWYLQQLAIEAVWKRTTGASSTVVVVIDDGCDLAHRDLAAHFEPGADLVDGDDEPSFVPGAPGNSHGTACAGIVAAVGDNGEGIAGTCPECHLRCVRLLEESGAEIPISRDVEAFARAREWGAAVVSNSWGFADSFPVPAPLAAAIRDVIENGRGGRGAIVVFAAGNDSRALSDDELTGVPGVINVGATNAFDEAAPFSNFGASVDLTAPAGTLTTDVSGAEGDDPGDYTSLFGGTSASCPVVAGVAALAVTLAPEASGADIAAALIETARPAPFAEPDENGHDPLYGHGVLDPVAALAQLVPPAEPDATDDGDGGGCGCRLARASAGDGLTWLLVAAWLWGRARHRAR